MSPRKPTILAVVYFTAVAVVSAAIVEAAAGALLKARIANSLPIFDCLLCDGQNVLTIKPRYSGTWETPAFKVSVRTNGRGFREDVDFSDHDVDIAFMGDSFTFGQGVEAEDRYSAIVASRFKNKQVVSLSYNNGFQPEHYEYFLEHHPSLQPAVVFVGLYLGNDLDTDLRETAIERRADGSIKTLALPYRGVFHGVQTNAGTYRYRWFSALVDHTNSGRILAIAVNKSQRLRLALSRPGAIVPSAMNRLSTELGQFDELNLRAFTALKQIARIVNQRGGQLHVLLIPQDYWFGEIDVVHRQAYGGRIEEIVTKRALIGSVRGVCEKEGLACHDLSTILTRDDYLNGDGHWNVAGHAKVGEYCSQIIEARTAVAR